MNDLRAGIYRYYKGPLYLVLGYAHDANSDELFEQVGERDFRRCDTTKDGDDTTRTVVVYVGLQLDSAHTGPRLAVRTVEDFFARVHEDGSRCMHWAGVTGNTSYCHCACSPDSLTHWYSCSAVEVSFRFTYVGPTWEGQ